MKKPELLAPAGSFEKAKTAFKYGADAIYCGTSSLSLRTRAEMKNDDLFKTIGCSKGIISSNGSFLVYPLLFRYIHALLYFVASINPNSYPLLIIAPKDTFHLFFSLINSCQFILYEHKAELNSFKKAPLGSRRADANLFA